MISPGEKSPPRRSPRIMASAMFPAPMKPMVVMVASYTLTVAIAAIASTRLHR
jgi:hypothetical protein